MSKEPITYISFNLGPTVGANDSIVGLRVVPNGKNDKEIYGRTLSPDELDTGEGITLEAGQKLVFPRGSVKVTLRDVDRYADTESDGYAAVANTVWTWLHVPPRPDGTLFHYLFAAARRLDRAHASCANALRELGIRPDEPFIKTRVRTFDALGNAELMCIALNRAIWMMSDAHAKSLVGVPVPRPVEEVQDAVLAIRNAFEHIDERVFGKARRETTAEAMSIFDQADFIRSGILKYAGHSLDLRKQAIPALVAARQFVYDAVAEAGTSKSINQRLEFGPFTNS